MGHAHLEVVRKGQVEEVGSGLRRSGSAQGRQKSSSGVADVAVECG